MTFEPISICTVSGSWFARFSSEDDGVLEDPVIAWCVCKVFERGERPREEWSRECENRVCGMIHTDGEITTAEEASNFIGYRLDG